MKLSVSIVFNVQMMMCLQIGAPLYCFADRRLGNSQSFADWVQVVVLGQFLGVCVCLCGSVAIYSRSMAGIKKKTIAGYGAGEAST